MMSILCMALMTTNSMRVMTFMHMHNELLMISSVKIKSLALLLCLCLLHQTPQFTKVAHLKRPSYKLCCELVSRCNLGAWGFETRGCIVLWGV